MYEYATNSYACKSNKNRACVGACAYACEHTVKYTFKYKFMTTTIVCSDSVFLFQSLVFFFYIII